MKRTKKSLNKAINKMLDDAEILEEVPIFLSKKENLDLFGPYGSYGVQSHICRTVTMLYEKSRLLSSIKAGIKKPKKIKSKK